MARTINDIKKADPSLADYSDEDVIDYLHKYHYQDVPLNVLEEKLGYERPLKKDIVNDSLVSIGQGTLNLVSDAPSVADIPAGLMGFDRPFSKATEAIGEATGFQPRKWADEAEQSYSPDLQRQQQKVNKVWEDPNTNAIDVINAYIDNPDVISKSVLNSLPSLVAGGLISKAALAKNITSNPLLAASGGEGLISATQAMSNIDESVDPSTAALSSLGTGVGVAAAAGVGGKVANAFGASDIEQILASNTVGRGSGNLASRVAKSALIEGPLEEGTQSAYETIMQNAAEGKPLATELARSITEGSLAGAAIGGGSGLISNNRPVMPPAAIAEAQSVDEAIVAATNSVNWQPPTFKDNPDATAIVKNRTIPAAPIQQAIDSQYQDSGYEPSENPWERPSFNEVRNQPEAFVDDQVQEKGQEDVQNIQNTQMASSNASVNLAAQKESGTVEAGNISLPPTDAGSGELLNDANVVNNSGKEKSPFQKSTGEFIPTHETSEGELVRETEEPSVFINAKGETISDDYATPLRGNTDAIRANGNIAKDDQAATGKNNGVGSGDIQSIAGPGREGRGFIDGGIGGNVEQSLPIEQGQGVAGNRVDSGTLEPIKEKVNVKENKQTKIAAQTEAPGTQTSGVIPPILTKTKKQYVSSAKQLYSKSHANVLPDVKKAAHKSIEDNYEEDLNKAAAGIPFDQYKALPINKGQPEGILKQAHDGLVKQYASGKEKSIDANESTSTPVVDQNAEDVNAKSDGLNSSREKQPWEKNESDSDQWLGSRVEIQPQTKREKPMVGTVKMVLKGSSSAVVEVQPDGMDSTFRYMPDRLKVLSVVDSKSTEQVSEQADKKQDNLNSTSAVEVPGKSAGEVKPKTGKYNANAKSGDVSEQFRMQHRATSIANLHAMNDVVGAYTRDEIHDISPENIDAVKSYLLKKYNEIKASSGNSESQSSNGQANKEAQERQLKAKITRAKTKLKESNVNLEEKLKLKQAVKDAEKELHDFRLNFFGQEDTQAAETGTSSDDSELQLNKKDYHPAIKSLANDLVEGGGVAILPDGTRSQSVNPSWFKDGAFIVLNTKGNPDKVSVREIKEAVSAHDKKAKLTGKQERILSALSDVAEAEEEAGNRGYPDSFDHEQKLVALDIESKLESGELSISDIEEALDEFDNDFDVGKEMSMQEINDFWGISDEETKVDGSPKVSQEEALTGYTETELATREREQKQRDKRQQQDEVKADKKAQADKEVDSVFDDMAGLTPKTADVFGMSSPMEKPSINTGDSGVNISKNDIPYEKARRAYLGISFSPEKRAQQVQDEYVDYMQRMYDDVIQYAKNDEDKARINSAFEDYRTGYVQKRLAHLNAKAQVLSPMITGPANFPVRRNERANATEHRRLEELDEWDKKALKRLNKIAKNEPEADSSLSGQLNEQKRKLERLINNQEKMKAANAAIRKNDDAKLAALGFDEKTIAELKAPKSFGGTGFAGFELTNNNANIKRVKDRIIDLERRIERAVVAESKLADEENKHPFKMVQNAVDNRLQLFFDGKPDEETRKLLKSNAFLWSPKNQAWQRQLTTNAIRAAEKIGYELKAKQTDSKTVLYSKSNEKTGLTLEAVKSLLPKRTRALVDAGKLKVVQSAQEAIDTGAMSFDAGNNVEGFYNPETDELFIISSNVNKDNLQSVVAHELYHRLESVDKKLQSAISKFDADFNKRFELASEGFGSEIEKKAYSRVVSAETESSDKISEFKAYLVSEYTKEPKSFPEKLAKIFKDFLASIRAALLRSGLDFGFIRTLTPADLFAMSKYGTKVNYGNAKVTLGGESKIAASAKAARFYSALKRAFIAAPDKVFGSPQQVKAWIAGNAPKYDVKKDEIYWTGLTDWLDMQTGKVSRDDVLGYLEQNGVQVEDVVLGEAQTKQPISHDEAYELFLDKPDAYVVNEYDGRISMDTLKLVRGQDLFYIKEGKSKHNNDQLTLPGGTDYRELVVTIPTTESFNESDSTHFGDVGKGKQIAWIRYNTRTDADGNSGLFLEEVQSQRGQSGRKGGFQQKYRKQDLTINYEETTDKLWIVDAKESNGSQTFQIPKSKAPTEQDVLNYIVNEKTYGGITPPAPFVTDSNNRSTNAYITLLMKKAVSQAIDNGQSFVSWTTGDQQAERYDLSKQIETVSYYPKDKALQAMDKNGNQVLFERGVEPNEIENYIGKEPAKKLLDQEPIEYMGTTTQEISGIDLKVGGAWTQSMYGNEQGLNAQGKPSLILQAANEIARKMGGKVGSVDLTKKTPPDMMAIQLSNGRWTWISQTEDGVLSDDTYATEGAALKVIEQLKNASSVIKQPALIITPEMKAKVLAEGMPLFSKKADSIKFSINNPNSLFSSLTDQPDSSTSNIVNKLRNFKGGARSTSREVFLSALTQNQLIDIGQSVLPILKRFGVQRNNYDTTEARWHQRADKIAERWEKLAPDFKRFNSGWKERNKREQVNLASVMHDMTASGIDPRQPALTTWGAEKMGMYTELKREYNKLLPTTKALLDDVERFHTAVKDELVSSITKKIKDMEMPIDKKEAMIRDIEAKFEGQSGPYFPLMRFGRYWVDYDGGVQMFETKEEQDQFIKEATRKGIDINGSGKSLQNFEQIEGIDVGFMTDINGLIDKLDVDQADALKDGIFQLYLSALPEQSMRKRFIHRKTTPGWEQDALRSFSKKAFHDGKQLAKMQYAPAMKQVLTDAAEIVKIGNSGKRLALLKRQIELIPELQEKLDHGIDYEEFSDLYTDEVDLSLIRRYDRFTNEIDRKQAMDKYLSAQKELLKSVMDYKANGNQAENAADILDALNKSYDNMMSPGVSPVANFINQAVFTYALGFNPASAIINYFQTPGAALPVVAGRHGFIKSSRALADAAKLFFTNKDNDGFTIRPGLSNQGEIDMFNALTNNGTFDRTRSHDLAGLSEEGIGRGTLHRDFMAASTFMFHKAEVANREITALMAYRMEYNKTGDIIKSIEYANDVVKLAHLDYSQANRPDLFQGNAARVMLQFKMYSQGMTYLWGKTAYDALVSKNPERKAEARNTIMALAGVQISAAGILGLPIGGLLMAAQALAGMMDDDDDPVDVELEIRRSLNSVFGDDIGRVLAKGVLSESGADFSGRLSMSDLWIRNEDRELEGRDKNYALLKTIVGPVGGLLENMSVGMELIHDGDTQRGIEKLLPNSVSGVAKAYRMIEEGGANSLSGNPIYETNTWEDILQAMGFRPSGVAEKQVQNTAFINREKAVIKSRSRLLNEAVTAKMDGDNEKYQAALKKINDWNVKYPTIKITQKTIRTSIKRRNKNRENAIDGIVVKKNYRFVRQEEVL